MSLLAAGATEATLAAVAVFTALASAEAAALTVTAERGLEAVALLVAEAAALAGLAAERAGTSRARLGLGKKVVLCFVCAWL